jgi:hypothetical protein
MKRSIAMVAGVVVSLVVTLAWGADFQVTPAMQQEVDKQIEAAKGWAAHPVVVDAVLDQNKKGPIPGMDNPVWKTTPDIEAVVQAFVNNQAAGFLKQRIGETNGICTGAFLNAAQGEKVAFTEKTGSYIHKGSAKFDVPFTTGKTWQGPPELDDSGKVYEIQVAVPVLWEGKPVGTLVVEINATKVEQLVRK